ncbi:MAG: DUF1566 domain-containing protein [bacterium]
MVVLTVAMLMAVTAFLPANINAGNLEPTDPPGPTMRTLDEIYSAVSWSKKIPITTLRFEFVLDDEAVLDKETGLVWDQSPDPTTINWYDACSYCTNREVGGRKGWRIPTVEELATLVDASVAGSPKLPFGYTYFFTNVQSAGYWTSNTSYFLPHFACMVNFNNGSSSCGGGPPKTSLNYYAWCVRGGSGRDGYPGGAP